MHPKDKKKNQLWKLSVKNYLFLDVPPRIQHFGLKPIITEGAYTERDGALTFMDQAIQTNIVLRNSRVDSYSRVVSVAWKSAIVAGTVTVFVSRILHSDQFSQTEVNLKKMYEGNIFCSTTVVIV